MDVKEIFGGGCLDGEPSDTLPRLSKNEKYNGCFSCYLSRNFFTVLKEI